VLPYFQVFTLCIVFFGENENCKCEIIRHQAYNETKSETGRLDKVAMEYACRRSTRPFFVHELYGMTLLCEAHDDPFVCHAMIQLCVPYNDPIVCGIQ